MRERDYEERYNGPKICVYIFGGGCLTESAYSDGNGNGGDWLFCVLSGSGLVCT